MATTAIIYDPGHHRVHLPLAVYPGGGTVVEVTRTRGAEVQGVPLAQAPLVAAARRAGASALQADAAAKAHARTAVKLALGAEAKADEARLHSARGNVQAAFTATRAAQRLADQSHAAAVASSTARAEQARQKTVGVHLQRAAVAVAARQHLQAQQAHATAAAHAAAPLRVVVPPKPQVIARTAPALHPAAPVSPVPDATSEFARTRQPTLQRVAPAAAIPARPVVQPAPQQAFLAARKAATSAASAAESNLKKAVASGNPAAIAQAAQAHAAAQSRVQAVEAKRADEVASAQPSRPTPSPAQQGFASKPSPAVPQRSSQPVDPNKGQIKSSTGLPISGPGWMDSVKAHVANTYTVPGGGLESNAAQSRYSTPGVTAGQKPSATRRSVKGVFHGLGGTFEPGGLPVPQDRPIAGWGDTSRHPGMLAGFGALNAAGLTDAWKGTPASAVDTVNISTGVFGVGRDTESDDWGIAYGNAGENVQAVTEGNKVAIKKLRVIKAYQAATGNDPDAAALSYYAGTKWNSVATLTGVIQAGEPVRKAGRKLDDSNYSGAFAQAAAKWSSDQQKDLGKKIGDTATGKITDTTGLTIGSKAPGTDKTTAAPETDGGKSLMLIAGGLALLAVVASKG